MRPSLRRLRTALNWSAGLLLCCASVMAAQGTGTVRGTVTDAVSKRPVDGVSVFVAGTDLGTLTNSLGQFQLNLPAGQVELRVRRVGYGTTSRKVTVTAGEVAQADFEVSQVAIGLDAVVVTGAGASTERRKVPNTVATINTDNLRNAPVVNVSEQLAAREPGVSLLPSGGLAGEGARIRIRGAASLSQPNEPIVYVDGVRVDRSGGWGDYVGTGGGGNPSRIDDINPEAVERIEVLKGAAAATLYGTEASAGVIQIFTRTGSRGAPRFDFTTEQGVSNFPNGRYEPNYGFARDASDPLRSSTRLNSFYGLSLQPYQVHAESMNFGMQLNHLALRLFRCPSARPWVKAYLVQNGGVRSMPLDLMREVHCPFPHNNVYPTLESFMAALEVCADSIEKQDPPTPVR